MTGAGGGSSVCTSCPAGTYNSEAGAGGVCTACSGSHSTSPLQTTSQADCECEVGFSGDAAHSEEYRMCATGSLKLLKGPGARFECTTTRFSMCLCNAMSRAHAGTLAAPSSESQLLQRLQATVPQQGTLVLKEYVMIYIYVYFFLVFVIPPHTDYFRDTYGAQ